MLSIQGDFKKKHFNVKSVQITQKLVKISQEHSSDHVILCYCIVKLQICNSASFIETITYTISKKNSHTFL